MLYPLPSNIGTFKKITGADPTAGVDAIDAVTAGKGWVLIGYRIVCVQGLTQTPLVHLAIDDGTNIVAEWPGSTQQQSVSTTTTYTFGPSLTLTPQVIASPNTRSTGPTPPGLFIPAGFRLRTSAVGIGANTDFGAPTIYVCEIGT